MEQRSEVRGKGTQGIFALSIAIFSLISLSSQVCFADDQQIVMTPQQVAEGLARGNHIVRAGGNQGPTPDQIAENSFANQNMVTHTDGSHWVEPKATGQRMVISSRLAVNEQGQLEAIPTNRSLARQEGGVSETRRQEAQFLEGVHTWEKEHPNVPKIDKASVDKTIEGMERVANDSQKRIDQWAKDKSGETKQFVPSVLVSMEKRGGNE